MYRGIMFEPKNVSILVIGKLQGKEIKSFSYNRCGSVTGSALYTETDIIPRLDVRYPGLEWEYHVNGDYD